MPTLTRRAVTGGPAKPLLGALALLATTWIGQPVYVALGQEDGGEAVNLEVVGHTDLVGRGHNAGVWAYRSYAYVGSSGPRGLNDPVLCPGLGVAIVDISDPRQPTLVTSVAQRPGTTAQDVQVLAVDSPAFRGDLLAAGIQSCSPDGVGGLSLWDVTDPRSPIELGFFEVGRGRLGVQEFTVYRRDGRAIALLAVPFSESQHPDKLGDVRIVDLTDPRAPVQLAHWGAERELGISPRQGQGRDVESYAHSVEVSPDGRFGYVSYWDTGVVMLDLADLRNPRVVGRTTFAPTDEGNAHSVALAKGGRVLVEADEDLLVRGDAIAVEGVPQLEQAEASYGAFRTILQRVGPTIGRLVYVGRGCPAGTPGLEGEDLYLANPAGNVAIVEPGGCSPVDKVLRAQHQGAVGVVIANPSAALAVPEGDVAGVTIPAAVVGQATAEQLKAALLRGETVTVQLGLDQIYFDDWGYLRFWDVSDRENPAQMAIFATANARTDRRRGPPDSGWYSAHQPAVLGDRLYVAWYSDGVRVLDISDPTQPREIGHFIPPRSEGPGGGSGPGTVPLVWGVFVRGDLVLVTDQHTGLYVLRDLTR